MSVVWTPANIGLAISLSIIPLVIAFIFSFMFPPGKWYAGLAKPRLTPSPWVYGLVWALLYPLLGVSVSLALIGKHDAVAWLLPMLNIALTLLFAPVFFGMHSLFGGVVITFLCLALGFGTVWYFSSLAEYVASGLMIPYVVWMLVAVYLAWSIYKCNCATPSIERRRRRSPMSSSSSSSRKSKRRSK